MARPIRVLALSSLPRGQAGTRHRAEQYARHFRPLGVELEVSPFFDAAAHRILYSTGNTLPKALGVLRGMLRRIRDLTKARRYDLFLILRESAPIGPPVLEWMLRRIGVPYVFDFDDAIYLRSPFSANLRWTWLRDPSRVAATARGAVCVIAGNEYLAEQARRWNRQVVVIMTPVDTERHTPRAGTRPPGPLVIGWLGQHTTAPYLRLLDKALAEVARHDEFILRVVGGRYANSRVRVEELEFDVDREPDDLRSFDVGVLPEPDDAWTRGKGAYKALTYMATGIPVVASRVGVNPEVIVDGETGYCVGSTEEWVSALRRLLRDPELRMRLGAEGRRRVEARYSLEVHAPRLARVLLDRVPAVAHDGSSGSSRLP